MEQLLSAFLLPDVMDRAGVMGIIRPHAQTDPLITGVVYDSRAVKPGNLYCALPGLHADGHDYIGQALDAGAGAVLVQRSLPRYSKDAVYIRAADSRFAMSPLADAFYGFPSRHLAVIGVTGTEGKSTTVYLIYQLLRLLGKQAGFISTVRFSNGADEADNPQHQTTPEAPAVHRLLAEMLENSAEFAVVEASSHGLSPRTNRLGDVAFDAGVMTNVTHEHLEFHGTWEQYRHDKANLFRALDRVNHGKRGREIPLFAVVNGDDPSADYFASAAHRPCYRFSAGMTGSASQSALSLLDIESGAEGSRYRAQDAGSGIIELEDRLPGAFNAGNVLASLITVSRLLSLPVEALVPLVPRLKPVRGRMTALDKGQDFEVMVDYAHTPSSFQTIFPPLRERIGKRGGRIISLFGSAGERDTLKRPEQGRIAAQWSDILVLTDEDPRGEDPLAILEEIARGAAARKRGEDLFLIPGRPAAIRKAFSLARKGDLVLLLGKGHENSIIYADKTIDYDEIREAEQALEELRARRL